MDSKKENPISLRSKKWITDALFKLMEEKKFEEITVTDISREADLVRQTFYKNFDSKEDVIKKYMEKLSDELVEMGTNIDKYNLKNLARLHLEFWYKKSDLLKLLIKHNLLDSINICYKKFIIILNDDSLKKDELTIQYSSEFFIGGLIKCIKKWVKDDFNISVDQLTNLILQIIDTDFFIN